MSKEKEIITLLDDLITAGNTLTATAQALKEFYTETAAAEADASKPKAKAAPKKEADTPAPEVETEAVQPKTYTKEAVRAVLAAKAAEAEGAFKSAVKEIVKKYSNGGTLTNVAEADYGALVAEVEALT